MDGITMEGPLPPPTKIDDDVDGVEVEVVFVELGMSTVARSSAI